MRHVLLGAIAMSLLAAPSPPPHSIADTGFDTPPVRFAPVGMGSGVRLRVMNYNVKGLPWPVVEDRSAELAAIGDRLKRMRRDGTAPDVVVLQEAFSGDARAIATRAGYRYILYGPDSSEASPPFPETPLPERYRWRGEGYGAYLSSGLVLMSNFPVVGSWRAAFPRTACAGYDCLANKGVLLARIAVPGLDVPVQIMTAHMNSRKPTRTPMPHANAAFTRQMAAIDRFVTAHADPRLPLIFAADLNLDSDPARIAVLEQSRARWDNLQGRLGDTAVFAVCGKPDLPCRPAMGFDAIVQNKRNNDWQLSFAGRGAAIQPVSAAIRFMPDRAGRTLSDHQAVMVDYRLSSGSLPSSSLALNGLKSVLSSKTSIPSRRLRKPTTA
jgi:endonuclease/exonuclease/phosphatase family metal-dependent hydrolase